MKVILLQDVARIGGRFETKEVPQGHAQNYLIPRKLAMPATPENIKRIEAQKRKQAEAIGAHEEAIKAALSTLQGASVDVTAEANEQGHLFKAVKAGDIVLRLKEMNVDVAETEILLPYAIKEVGKHEITLSSGGTEGTFTLVVNAK